MKKEYFLFTIFPIILVAGCVSLPQQPSTISDKNINYSTSLGGLSLLLSSDRTVIKDVTFLVTGVVKNYGDQEASNIKVKLVRDSGDLYSEDFDVTKSVVPDPLPPGEETTPLIWSIKPAGIGSASIGGTISYHYRTVLEMDLDVFGYSYISSGGKAYEEYKSSPGIKRFVGSKSPIVLSVSPLQKPLLVREGESPAITFYIQNPGNGAVRNLVFRLTSNPEGKVTCSSEIDERAINFGTKYPIVCRINYGENELKDGAKVVTVRLILEYDYTNVKVSPITLNVAST